MAKKEDAELTGMVKEIVSSTLKEVMAPLGKEMATAMATAMMATQQASQMSEYEKTTKAIKAKQALQEKCSVCRQIVGDGKGRGCGGPWRRNPVTGEYITEPMVDADGKPVLGPDEKPIMRRIEDPGQFHILRDVFPTDPIAAEYWSGITINGALYMSNGPGHKIWVPRNSDIDSIISAYSEGERIQRNGRKHVRKNAGTLSGNAGQSNTLPPGMGY